jgi:hypothetical protein
MNDQTDHLDQTDEDILPYAVSDKALEAAGFEKEGRTAVLVICAPATRGPPGC